jgi:hypothetical protein
MSARKVSGFLIAALAASTFYVSSAEAFSSLRFPGRQSLSQHQLMPLVQLKEKQMDDEELRPEVSLRGGSVADGKTLVREMIAEYVII